MVVESFSGSFDCALPPSSVGLAQDDRNKEIGCDKLLCETKVSAEGTT